MADCADDMTMQHHIHHAKEQLQQYYQANYAAQVPTPISQPHVATISLDSPQKVNFTAQYKKWPPVMNDELEMFYRLPQEDFDTCDLRVSTSALVGDPDPYLRVYRLSKLELRSI